MSLEEIFESTAKSPPGECSLPEPGRDAPPITQPQMIRVGRKEDYLRGDLDAPDNRAESKKFRERISEIAQKHPEVREWIKENKDKFGN